MPALLIAAVFALRALFDRPGGPGAGSSGAFGRVGRAGRALAVIGALTVLVYPTVVTAPAFTIREEVPQLAQVDAICAAVGRSGAVVELDQSTQYSYQQTIRSYCNVPSLGLPHEVKPAELAAVRASVLAHGRTLYALMSSTKGITFNEAATGPPEPFSSARTTRWPSTLSTAPTKPIIEVVTVFLGRVDPDGRLVELVKGRT